MLYLEMFTDSATELKPGTYTFATTNTAGTFSDYSSWETYPEGDDVSIASGKVVIAKPSAKEYEITVEGTDKNGKEIKAYYRGKLLPSSIGS